MADQEKPRVKLPDTIARKPAVPGLNSWAQSRQEQQQRSSSGDQPDVGQATNRDKYEHKPMPPPPTESQSQNRYLQAKVHIQPAIPLVNPRPKLQSQQKRAVTDPVPPKPLFTGRKLSVAKLRKKYSFSKETNDVPEAEAIPTDQSSSVIQLSSEKAAEVLGLYPPPANKPDVPPAPAPSAPVLDPFRPSSDSVERATTPPGQIQSMPAPTRRYLRENDLPTPTITEAPFASKWHVKQDPQDQDNDPKKAEAHNFTPGMLQPPKLGRYGNMGEVELVEANEMHRVESFSGVIENAESSPDHNRQISSGSTGALSQSSMTHALNTGDLVPPVIYSPSNYGGVWENDPAVVRIWRSQLASLANADYAQGYSLPPFSPLPNWLPPKDEASGTSPFDNRGLPVMHNKFRNDHRYCKRTDLPSSTNFCANTNSNPNTGGSLDYHHPLPSANSWASGNSFKANNAPLSALLPRNWPNHHNNSVPSPPHNQHDYQRPGSMSAAMARLELTLHHHIDSTAGSLSRLITDKHDRIMDQTIRRLDNIEEVVSKGFRNIKNDLKDIKRDIGSLKGELKDVAASSEISQDIFKRLDAKLEALEKSVEEHSCKCQLVATEPSPHMSDRERQKGAASHRRTESAHGALGQGEHRRQYQSGASCSANSARHSANSNRAHRSNTSKSQPSNGMSEEMDSRREYFAELGAARGPKPDLRDHPAFSGMQQAQGQMYHHDQNEMPSILNDLPYEPPSLSNGRWYQQAYGQSH